LAWPIGRAKSDEPARPMDTS